MADDARGQAALLSHAAGWQIITIAGVQDGWVDSDSRECQGSCSMLVTNANKFVAGFDNRMPVILESGDLRAMERGSTKDAAALMKLRTMSCWKCGRCRGA